MTFVHELSVRFGKRGRKRRAYHAYTSDDMPPIFWTQVKESKACGPTALSFFPTAVFVLFFLLWMSWAYGEENITRVGTRRVFKGY